MAMGSMGWDAAPPVRERGRRLLRPIHGVVAALLLAGVLLHVWHRVQVIQLGYQIEQLQRQKKALERVHHALQIEVAALSAPHRIEKVARRLRMRPLHRQQVVVVRFQAPAAPEEDGTTVAHAREPGSRRTGKRS